MENKVKMLLSSQTFLTDGGLETDLIFNRGIDLPHSAAFTLYEKPGGKEELYNYYREYLNIARRYNLNFILETPTWRCNPDWGYKLGYSLQDVKEINAMATLHMQAIRLEFETDLTQIIVSGNIGPRGDGYKPENIMTAGEAEEYHSSQIEVFINCGVDIVSAFTMNYLEESLGIVNAAKKLEVPVVISFTLETDGRLPNGETLDHAISVIDKETGVYPLYYMINCAHPLHFKNILSDSGFTSRLKGIRANSSVKSHEELDNSEVLDKGDKDLLAEEYRSLRETLPGLSIIGGCCGTDHTHIARICKSLF